MFARGYETRVLKRYVMKAIKIKPKVTGASLCKSTTLVITMSTASSLVAHSSRGDYLLMALPPSQP